jgi:hypothetical protein
MRDGDGDRRSLRTLRMTCSVAGLVAAASLLASCGGSSPTLGDLPVEAGSIEAQVNSGVGVVTPSRMIEEAYEMEELAEDRQRLEEREKGREEGETLDRVAGADADE